MKLKDVNFVFKTTIKLSDVTSDEALKNETITLREPTAVEFSKFSDNASDNIAVLRKLFPSCVVNSTFEDENGNTDNGDEIFKLLDKSASTMTKILNLWINSCPFSLVSEKKEN